MDLSRRRALTLFALAAGAPLAGGALPAAGAARRGASPARPDIVDEDTLRFWQDYSHRVLDLSGPPRGGALDFERMPAFAVYTPQLRFRIASQITDRELLGKGNAGVAVRVLSFRPSISDRQHFVNLQSGSLRLDMQQGKPASASSNTVAWSVMAGLQPDAKGQMAPLDELSFNPALSWGRAQEVTLPGGGGYWRWNFFVQRRQSFWSRMVGTFCGGARSFFPVLGLPGLAVKALSGFDQLFGLLVSQSKSTFLFQSATEPMIATQAARQDAQYAAGVPVRDAQYVILPRGQLASFSAQMAKMKLTQGVIVPADTAPGDVWAAAPGALPNITYLTVAFSVRPLPANLCAPGAAAARV